MGGTESPPELIFETGKENGGGRGEGRRCRMGVVVLEGEAQGMMRPWAGPSEDEHMRGLTATSRMR